MFFANIIKAVILGIIEGITEWLPISSTGHLILADEFIKLDASSQFMSMFNVVIQLGAILAVVVLYFHKLNPFSPSKSTIEKKDTWISFDVKIDKDWVGEGFKMELVKDKNDWKIDKIICYRSGGVL